MKSVHQLKETNMSQNLVESLKNVLADHYVLYLKTQNYHWNVTGPHFRMLHEMFEEQYRELIDPIDEIAERIRTLGEIAPASFAEYEKLSSISSGNAELTGTQMVEDLYKSHLSLIETLKDALKAAQDADDEVSIGLITDRLTVHEKTGWMLHASLGSQR